MRDALQTGLQESRGPHRSTLRQTRESIGVTEMIIGKWYDPISQRWIVPREARPMATHSPSGAKKVPDTSKTGEAERIWHLLVDCCAGG
ncbi:MULTISPECIES: hypothetical protein [unclassified Bradyrhizobium]|uniref:hypothetical protein n=1 Tax=unclassified Bradyrhizobium TaxID=2631580 RepID=UPI002118B374|nr:MULTISPECIES: hypothetical protein [unclassified Bradyrhizobium]